MTVHSILFNSIYATRLPTPVSHPVVSVVVHFAIIAQDGDIVACEKAKANMESEYGIYN